MHLSLVFVTAVALLRNGVSALRHEREGVWSAKIEKRFVQRDDILDSDEQLKVLSSDIYAELSQYPTVGLALGHMLTIKVGTPPQDVQVLVDTGSPNLWIEAIDYGSCVANKDACAAQSNYSVSLSSTSYRVSSDQYVTGYGKGNVVADIFTETVILANATMPKFPLGIASKQTAKSGILGLGPRAGAAHVVGRNSSVVPTFLESLLKQGRIASMSFSIALGGNDTGSIIFGGIDTGKYNRALQVMPLVANTTSEKVGAFVNFNSLDLEDTQGSKTFSSNTTRTLALLDTGSSVTYFPRWLLQSLYQRLGIQPPTGSSNKPYTPFINCQYKKDGTTLTFNLGSASSPVAITVPLSALIYTEVDKCALSIWPYNNDYDLPFIQLGHDFISQVYMVVNYDSAQVAMAPLRTDYTTVTGGISNGYSIQPMGAGQGIPTSLLGGS